MFLCFLINWHISDQGMSTTLLPQGEWAIHMVFILHKWVFLVVSSGFELMKEATFGQKMIINLIDVSCLTFFF